MVAGGGNRRRKGSPLVLIDRGGRRGGDDSGNQCSLGVGWLENSWKCTEITVESKLLAMIPAGTLVVMVGEVGLKMSAIE